MLSPATIIFSANLAENIKDAMQIAGNTNKLCPHDSFHAEYVVNEIYI
jgi:hypothetical protein